MKVVHISTADWLGGAARAAYRLHAGLQCLSEHGAPVQSSMLVASRVTGDPSVLQFRPHGGLIPSALRRIQRFRIDSQLTRASRSRPNGFEPFNGDRSAYQNGELIEALPNCDLVNLHWVSELIDYATFLPRMCAKMPVVWTLHDMNVLTGGCHYDDGCGLHEKGCGSCPQLGSSKGHDLASHIWKRKRKLFASLPANRLHVVAPSRWLADAARSSPLLGRFDVTLIPYGLDTKEFSPRGRGICRQALGIPDQSRVLLFVAQSSSMRRKGFELLQQALMKLPPANLLLLSVGGGESPVDGPIRRVHLGNVEHDRILTLAYGAADVFVIPSIQDNLPNTVLESMSCGTPVVGFSVGGIPDMVRPGDTGALAPAGNVDALAAAIRTILDDDEGRRRMGENCRRVALEEYDSGAQARRYMSLYASLLEAKTQ